MDRKVYIRKLMNKIGLRTFHWREFRRMRLKHGDYEKAKAQPMRLLCELKVGNVAKLGTSRWTMSD